MLDNGIMIIDYFINYECIAKFSYLGDTINIVFFGKVLFDKTIAKISLAASQIEISFNFKQAGKVCDTIKWNMYYHFKYNKVHKNMLILFK